MGQIALLSLLTSLNPTLVAATTVMLLLERPARLMTGYLLGSYTASLTCVLVIVFALPHSGATSTTQDTLSPLADVALGTVALAVAFVRIELVSCSVRSPRDDAHVFIARLTCSDPECAAAVTAEGSTAAELETLVCECGCALEVLGWPDWVDEPAEVVALRIGRPDLRDAA